MCILKYFTSIGIYDKDVAILVAAGSHSAIKASNRTHQLALRIGVGVYRLTICKIEQIL